MASWIFKSCCFNDSDNSFSSLVVPLKFTLGLESSLTPVRAAFLSASAHFSFIVLSYSKVSSRVAPGGSPVSCFILIFSVGSVFFNQS